MRTVEPEALGLADGDRLLDVGCGEGRHMHAAHAHAAVRSVGVDVDAERLRSAREGFSEVGDVLDDARFDVAVGDALSLPFPAASFDAVVCAEVLEHLPEYGEALDEIARVLKPGGRLGVSVPRYGPERVCWALSEAYHQVEGGHVRIFSRRELEAALSARGLRPVDSAFAHGLHSPLWWMKCLWWDREDDPTPLRAYERLLEWDIRNGLAITRLAEAALKPLVGKSLVLYCVREGS